MQGDVSFLELGSTGSDTAKSQTFFAAVFGWQIRPLPQGTAWLQGPRIRVGLHGNDPGPKVYVFFEVPNLESGMERVRLAGGYADPVTTDEAGFGRFANCQDPLGIPFGLHQPSAS
jgi:hypothetical protein